MAKVYKHAPTYLVNVDVLRIHIMQFIGVTLTFTFNTSRADVQGFNVQALVHQIATGIYAVITCLELLVRQTDEADFLLHLISYGLLAISFVILNASVKVSPNLVLFFQCIGSPFLTWFICRKVECFKFRFFPPRWTLTTSNSVACV